MKSLYKSVGLVARFDNKEALELVENLADHLEAKGLQVYIEDTLTDRIKVQQEKVPLENMKADFIITIGGDGTILRTCVSIPKPEPPVLGINMGVRGFLTEVKPKEAFKAVDKCLNGKFNLEKCMKLSITVDGMKLPDALNEVYITADQPTKLLYARIIKDKEMILQSQADGLIIATPTGSTGYSLSAGGPVLAPRVNAFVFTPTCSLSVFSSIVFPADTNLRVEVQRPRETLVVVDGQHREVFNSELTSIIVTCSKYNTNFIRFKENFYRRLRSRFIFKGYGG